MVREHGVGMARVLPGVGRGTTMLCPGSARGPAVSGVLMADPLLLGPAALFLASTAYTTAVAATEHDLPGEPFGLRVPGRVRTHLALGWGSASRPRGRCP